MKKLAALLIIFAVGLWAADFWQAKPFTEWSDKDVTKMTTNSPWAKEFSVEMPGGAEGGKGGKSGGKRDGGQTGSPDAGGGAPSLTLTIRWVSALPVKQALVRLNFKG